MRKEKLLTKIFIYIMLIHSCSIAKNIAEFGIYEEDISLLLKASDITTSDSLTVNCILINSSNKKIALLKNNFFNIDETESSNWFFEILFKDNEIQKYVPSTFMGDFKLPDENDYLLIEPLDSLSVDFLIDFRKLANSPLSFSPNERNTDFGVYKLKCYYRDNYCRHEKALKNKVESNRIEIEYVPNLSAGQEQ